MRVSIDLQRLLTVLALSTGALALAASPAFADGVFTDDVTKDDADKKDDIGWDASLSIGASVSFVHIDNMVGQTEGISVTLGYSVDAGLVYIADVHDWRNRLKISAMFALSPVVENQFIKSGDVVDFESIYYLRLVDWIGPFARFRLKTSMFAGREILAAPGTFLLPSGTTKVTAEKHLTDPFSPITLAETIGAFVRPYTTDPLAIEIRAGIGARQVIADEQFRVSVQDVDVDGDGVAETGVHVVEEIGDSQLVGAEAGLYLNGKFEGDRVTYGAFAEVLVPFYDSTQDELSVVDALNFEAGLKVSFKLVEWASLDLEYKALLQPQVEEEWQTQLSALLTIGYTLLEAEAK